MAAACVIVSSSSGWVPEWPADEQELFRQDATGLWADFETRRVALDLLRRGVVADCIVDAFGLDVPAR